jgi:hypothetical protein
MTLALRHLVLAVTFGVALLGAAAWGYAYGQGAVMVTPVTPRVFSGAEIGFRMEGKRGDTPTGTLVIRQNNEWVEVAFSGGMKLITK